MTPDVPEHNYDGPPVYSASELRRRKRLKLVLAGSVLAALLVLASLLWLFAPGDSNTHEAPENVKSLPQVDGTLTVVEDRSLTMQTFTPVDGKSEVQFTIREPDAKYFDKAHLESHSSIALPTRIYYEKAGGQYFARFADDAPANSQTGS